ncbi:Cell wall integrity protein scw1 [Elsinoe australis]|uniref:Cell wall integrity protein scw1 n=1 Tax=Elsinoe australis TaxID=40998 RepID=A0A2P7YWB1_9PEZI|nr:Cell wall integrity protein scw1 [Elsinoe australis]
MDTRPVKAVYVGNLSPKTTSDELKAHFGSHDLITGRSIAKSKLQTHNSPLPTQRNYQIKRIRAAFVVLSHPFETTLAVRKVSDTVLHARRLVVRYSSRPSDRVDPGETASNTTSSAQQRSFGGEAAFVPAYRDPTAPGSTPYKRHRLDRHAFVPAVRARQLALPSRVKNEIDDPMVGIDAVDGIGSGSVAESGGALVGGMDGRVGREREGGVQGTVVGAGSDGMFREMGEDVGAEMGGGVPDTRGEEMDVDVVGGLVGGLAGEMVQGMASGEGGEAVGDVEGLEEGEGLMLAERVGEEAGGAAGEVLGKGDDEAEGELVAGLQGWGRCDLLVEKDDEGEAETEGVAAGAAVEEEEDDEEEIEEERPRETGQRRDVRRAVGPSQRLARRR